MTTTFTPRPLPALEAARAHRAPAERLRELRRAALTARDAILGEGAVTGLATCPIVTFPYSTSFAFSGAALSPAPYVMLTNRMQVVQFVGTDDAPKTLLFNPTDALAGQSARFFSALRQRYGSFLSDRVMSTYHGTVQGHLERLGLAPAEVDYIAFDHLHVQDVRGWLGTAERPAFFPRAKMLVQRAEWEATRDLHPFSAPWYVADGTAGIPDARVELLDGDAWLGRGVALVKTQGHTHGNQSLAVSTGEALYVCSENGVAVETYTPLASHIPGLRRYAEHLGYEVVLNGNTREGSMDQYTSMILEKTLAGPSRADAAFCNFIPSSELTASLLAPGLAPTFSHGEVSHGALRSVLRTSGGPRTA